MVDKATLSELNLIAIYMYKTTVLLS